MLVIFVHIYLGTCSYVGNGQRSTQTLTSPVVVPWADSSYDFAGMAALTGTRSSPPGKAHWPLLPWGKSGPRTARENDALFSMAKEAAHL